MHGDSEDGAPMPGLCQPLDGSLFVAQHSVQRHVYMAPAYYASQGVAVACGQRGAMEDFALAHGSLADAGRFCLYAVFDGHAGAGCALFAHRTLPSLMSAEIAAKSIRNDNDACDAVRAA